MNRARTAAFLVALILATSETARPEAAVETLPGTDPLTLDGDLASRMVDGIDRFLTRELAASVAMRERFWQRASTSV